MTESRGGRGRGAGRGGTKKKREKRLGSLLAKVGGGAKSHFLELVGKAMKKEKVTWRKRPIEHFGAEVRRHHSPTHRPKHQLEEGKGFGGVATLTPVLGGHTALLLRPGPPTAWSPRQGSNCVEGGGSTGAWGGGLGTELGSKVQKLRKGELLDCVTPPTKIPGYRWSVGFSGLGPHC